MENIIMILFVLFVIMILFQCVLKNEIIKIMRKNGEKINFWDLYYSFNLFKNFIDNNELIKKNEYIKLYKIAIYTKRIIIIYFISLIITGVILINWW